MISGDVEPCRCGVRRQKKTPSRVAGRGGWGPPASGGNFGGAACGAPLQRVQCVVCRYRYRFAASTPPTSGPSTGTHA
ncbi:hypothetical protein DM56_3874 [Burkholderia mallei]|nr:hypothetical protein DP43_4921 [Burkholderia pseudomallei]KOT00811.1 hypothetical protein DM50_2593 [Burkholderia mallei]KOT11020.1 hypothetical protein DM56_3874 [Burkholderia mallei]KOT18177.1 hypothetical protein DM47_1561 [Burkholderia mallei]